MATYNFDSTTVQTKEGQRSLLVRTFLYMLGLLLITAAVSLIMHFILVGAKIDFSQGGTIIDVNSRSFKTYMTILSVSGIVELIVIIWMMVAGLRSGKIVLPAILYSVCMGVFISSFSFVLEWYVITAAFAISALCFGAMALVGYLSKNASGMGMIGSGLLVGILMAGLFNLLFSLLIPGFFRAQTIVTSVIIVVAIMLVTAYDVWQIKEISQRGLDSGNNNLAFYLAFNLYLDFIVIFIHIIRLIAMFASDRN